MFSHKARLVPSFSHPCGFEYGGSKLLGLVDQKGQHHQHDKDFAQMLFPEAVIVLKVVALILEDIEGFVLYLPAGATAAHEDIGVVPGDGKIGNP
jgi:hypothetical protein